LSRSSSFPEKLEISRKDEEDVGRIFSNKSANDFGFGEIRNDAFEL